MPHLLATATARSGPQRDPVDLGVERGGLAARGGAAPADLRQRRALPEHPGRRGVPQAVRADRRQPGPVARGADHPRDRAAVEPGRGRVHPQEQRPALAARATAKVGHDRLADIDRQRQHVVTAALAANEQLAATPVEVIEAQRGDLPGAQPEPRQQQQDRVSHAGRPDRRLSQLANSLLHCCRFQATRQGAIAQIRDRRDRPHQRRARSAPPDAGSAITTATRTPDPSRRTRCASGTRAPGTRSRPPPRNRSRPSPSGPSCLARNSRAAGPYASSTV